MFEWLGIGRNDEPARPRERVEPTIGNLENGNDFVDVPSSDPRVLDIFGLTPTAAGAMVNAVTANRVAAVYACRRLIAGAISTLPLPIYKRTDDGGRERVKHPYWWLLNEEPTPRFTAASFWEFVTSDMLMRGDGIAYIQRPSNNGFGVSALIPWRRDNVAIYRADDRLRYVFFDTIDGKRGYFTADQDDVLHFPGDAFNGIFSLSVIGSAARQAIGIAMKADEFAGTFFGSGAAIQYAATAPKKMTPEQQKEFRDAWLEKYGQGKGGISKIPLVLTEGMDVKELSMTAEDAQLLEARKFQVADIARAFGVPPHMIGETSASTSWGTGIESMSIGFVKFTLKQHTNRFAQELNRKLFPRIDRYFTEYNYDALLEGDSKTQADVIAKALGGPGTQGYMAVDEIRKIKNLAPMGGWAAEVMKAGGDPKAPPAGDNGDEPPDPNEPKEGQQK